MTWITNNGAAAVHSVNVTKAGVYTLKYWNHDDSPEDFTFRVNANKLPKGTTVSLTDTHPDLKANAVSLTVSGSHHNATARARVPAKHAGAVKVTIKTPQGGVLPAGSSVHVVQHWKIGPDHKHYRDAAKQLGAFEAFSNRQPIEVRLGSYTLAGEDYGGK